MASLDAPSEAWWDWLFRQPRQSFDQYFDGYYTKEEILENFIFRPWDPTIKGWGRTEGWTEYWQWHHKTNPKTEFCWVVGGEVPVWSY